IIVEEIKPDVIALGYDQRLFSTEELEAKLFERGLKVKAVRLPEMEQDLAGSRKIISKIMRIYRKKYGSE
ncbi:MAG: FAD synthase, partial [Candidatus Thermoplasmatota archaeon]|nr:FAD synthase [Candidatus Thermoplasmatota archaeon]